MQYGPPVDPNAFNYYQRRALSLTNLPRGKNLGHLWLDGETQPVGAGWVEAVTGTGAIDNEPNSQTGGVVELKTGGAGGAYELHSNTPIVNDVANAAFYMAARFKVDNATLDRYLGVGLDVEADNNQVWVGVAAGLDTANYIVRCDGDMNAGAHSDLAAIDTSWHTFEMYKKSTDTALLRARIDEGAEVTVAMSGSTGSGARHVKLMIYDNSNARSMFVDFVGCWFSRV